MFNEEFLPRLDKQLSSSQLAAFCRHHHIRRMALFGSALRADFNAESDLDILVEFEAGHTPGLDFFEIEAELARLLGRPVDLNTLHFISPYLRPQVQAQAQVLYEQP